MHTDETPESLPSNLRIGNGTDAEYNLIPHISQYENNPLIAALPPILNPKEAANVFACYPSLPKELDTNPAIRMHQLEAMLQSWYQPTSETIELAYSTDLLLRAGYQVRNPFLAHTIELESMTCNSCGWPWLAHEADQRASPHGLSEQAAWGKRLVWR